MNLHKNYAVKNECFNAAQNMIPKGIILHSTGANNPNLKRYVQPDDGLLGANPNGNSWNNPKPDGAQKCCHAFIGKLKDGSVATYQILPWNICCWSSGAGNADVAKKNGFPGNNANFLGYIQFEICEDDLQNAEYFSAIYKESVELCAFLCREYNISPDKPGIICHSEGNILGIASNHGDVMHWFPKFGKNMDTFRSDVKLRLIEAAADPAQAPLYRVQVGAFGSAANAEAFLRQVKLAGYSGSFVTKIGEFWKVQVGAFSVKSNADKYCTELRGKGLSAFVVRG